MTAYYNEIDPRSANWLRKLIKAGLIAPGDVDERSIEDVRPSDLQGYTQCHFFAGVGLWSLALRQAGIPDTTRVWTGSCPCQPFSSAGKGDGFVDKRHLWPAWYWLIEKCRPPVVFGEQVSSKDAEPWLDLVSTDMEALGFAVGPLAFPSAGVGSPSLRDRLYWVADTPEFRREFRRLPPELRGMGNTYVPRLEGYAGNGSDEGREGSDRPASSTSLLDGMADTCSHRQCGKGSTSKAEEGREPRSDGRGQLPGGLEGRSLSDRKLPVRLANTRDSIAGPTNGLWGAADWLLCRDGKWRPAEPGTFPLAHGNPERVGRLFAYGNAINPEAARIYMASYFDAISEGAIDD